jgi:hypothetical protein
MDTDKLLGTGWPGLASSGPCPQGLRGSVARAPAPPDDASNARTTRCAVHTGCRRRARSRRRRRRCARRRCRVSVARQHVGRRVAEAAAVAGLHHGHPRRHGVEKAVGRRGAAAVVRHQQHVAAQAGPGARPAPAPAHARCRPSAARCPAAGLTRSTQLTVLGRPAGVACVGVQHLEVDAVPGPALAGVATRCGTAWRAAGGRRPRNCSARRPGNAASSDAAPPTWSVSRWLSISRSMPVAAATQQRQQHPLAGVGLGEYSGPVS